MNPKQLASIEQMYMNKINKRNAERFEKEKKTQFHYRVTGAILISCALSIYAYTMYSIRQEKFLDDFDVPEPPEPGVSTPTKGSK